MIIYSPNSKYTMQRIADCVSNGAYFYATFRYELERIKNDDESQADISKSYFFKQRNLEKNANIEKINAGDTVFETRVEVKSVESIIEKLTERYKLNMTPRQRTYALDTGKPIATLIVQEDLYDMTVTYFYLFFTTPLTRAYNATNGVDEKKLTNAKQREKIAELKKNTQIEWKKPEIQAEKDKIIDFFKDKENLQFVLSDVDRPRIKVAEDFTLELVRENHKNYTSAIDRDYKDRVKSYSWTWRYTQVSNARIKKKLIDHVNKLISQKSRDASERNRASVSNYLRQIETWSVFKGTRKQAGVILHFAHRFMKSRLKKTWQQVDIEVPQLKYLPRLEKYADTYALYCEKRSLFHTFGREFSNEEMARPDFQEYLDELLLEL